ncbi:hypothetical protein OPV22_030451 [Ensete ventricosum]|uniref:Uncharacterized protein n=1 Tax=Ensete ventricosum TaxID=4639 RepID=A0AAV8Q9V4_ENSVE|nr:hypothetical protein OPV22_030451 [Ensete ventricosum]
MAKGKDFFFESILRENTLKSIFSGRRRKRTGVAEDVGDPIPQLSSFANCVVARCSRILHISSGKLQQSFETEFPDRVKLPTTYARDLFEYCCFRTFHTAIKSPDYLADKEFRQLTFDMMLAWESPGACSESIPKESNTCDHLVVEEEHGVSFFYSSSSCLAAQVDERKTVGSKAFARIAPACPAIADSITVNNLFDALTCCSSGGRMHFFIYDKYLKSLHKEIKSVKNIMGSMNVSNLHLSDGEVILEVDGVMPTQPVLQHIGTSAWPGRLTLTTHALYFESLGVGYDKAVRYDLATDQRQVIKGDLTGPLGARLFDKAVMYKSISLAGPVYFGFPEFKGHSRRDYWLAVVREVLQVHKFIRKYYDLDEIQQMESLSKAMLGIFRYRALKEAFHIHPPRFRSILGFYLAEKLPKGDKILEAFYDYLKLPPDLHGGGCPLPFSLYTVAKMGFAPNMEAVVDGVEEKCILVGDVCVGSTSSSLETAVKESFCCSEIAEAARATVDQMKVDGIDTNLAVMKELLFPVLESTKLLRLLVNWENPLKSTSFLVLNLYVVYRGWVRYVLSCISLYLALLMMWHKASRRKRKPLQVLLRIRPPRPTKNAVEQLLVLQDGISRLATMVQAANVVLLKLRALLFAAAPKATDETALTLIVAATLVAVVPFGHLMVLTALEGFTREMPLRRKTSEKLRRRLREWWARIPAAPVELVRHKSFSSRDSVQYVIGG